MTTPTKDPDKRRAYMREYHRAWRRAKGIPTREELRLIKRASKRRGVPCTTPATKKGPTNAHSREGVLRSPDGRLWPFRNVCHFVREHPELFEPKDRAELPVKSHPGKTRINAANALLQLFGNGKEPRTHWKGWTAVKDIIQI